ncbi:MAG TPA: SIMPL domain-containing protein [Candidatus Babeliales bacterium]|nr:SIMPL domain-containing protein [Candidatus Babeliales bacterium]
MKRTHIALLVALAVLVNAGAAVAASTEITAAGTGSVSLPPDVATIAAAIETNAQNADDAIAQNNTTYDRIVSALTKLGISRSDVALVYYNVSYNPRPSQPTAPGERYGYTVSRSFSVKVRAIGSAGRVSDACIAAGATSIEGVTFGLASPAAARTQATEKAVAQARDNAETLAKAAALRIVGIKSIELADGGPGPVPMMRAATPSASTRFDASTVNVTVSVSIVFLAEP